MNAAFRIEVALQAARSGRMFQEIGSVWDSVALVELEDDEDLEWNMGMYRNYTDIASAT